MVSSRDRDKGQGSFPLLWGALVFVVTFVLYLPALKNGFVPWDDLNYITENPHIRDLSREFFSWAWTTFYAANWHPITWISHAIDYALYGLNPMGHHLTNILFHAANTALVFFLLFQFIRLGVAAGSSISPSIAAGVGALLFGIHPLHVESVAWVAERKDLLCAFFLLVATLFYLQRDAAQEKRWKRVFYIGTLFFFALALCSKPMAVTFPVVLLILDEYPLARIRRQGRIDLRRVTEKAPFLVLSLLSVILTVRAHAAGGAIPDFEQSSIWFWICNPFYSLAFYGWKFLFPVRLSPLYEIPHRTLFLKVQYLMSVCLFAAIVFYTIREWRRGHRLAMTLWLLAVVMLLPVLGIIKVGRQIAADRYMYLPSIPLVLLVGLGFEVLRNRVARERIPRIRRTFGVVLIFAWGCSMSFLTFRQLRVWKNGESLWKQAIDAYPEASWFARFQLASVYSKRGDFKNAWRYYSLALKRVPIYTEAMNQMGMDYARWGHPIEARREFMRAIRARPKKAAAYANLALLDLKQRRVDEATRLLSKALSLQRDYVFAHRVLGAAYLMQGKLKDSVRESAEAARLDPMDTSSRENLGRALMRLGRWNEALQVYKELVTLEPDNPRIRRSLKALSARAGRR